MCVCGVCVVCVWVRVCMCACARYYSTRVDVCSHALVHVPIKGVPRVTGDCTMCFSDG